MHGYKKDDIQNMDETGSFWKEFPEKGFGVKGRQGKKQTESNCSSVRGRFWWKGDPIVIGSMKIHGALEGLTKIIGMLF